MIVVMFMAVLMIMSLIMLVMVFVVVVMVVTMIMGVVVWMIMIVVVWMIMSMVVRMLMIVVMVVNAHLLLLGHGGAHGADHPADNSRPGTHEFAFMSAPLHKLPDLLPDRGGQVEVGID